MELSEMQARAAELERLIFFLPAGSITKKTVNGKEYFYHRWTENKKRREKYIPADELENFRAQIEQRKALERELKALKKQLPKAKPADTSASTTNVRTGEALRSFAASIRGYAQARVLPAAARLCLRRAAGQGVHSLRPAPDGENHHDPPVFCGDERRRTGQGCVHPDHRKRQDRKSVV